MSVLIFLIIYYVLLCITLSKLFEKAEEAGWKAYVPGLNFVVWCKIIGRPGWWAALLLLPIVNVFILAGMCVDMVRSFGKNSFGSAALAVIYAPIPFFQIGREPKDKYLGPVLDLEKQYQQQITEAKEKKDEYQLKKLEANNPYRKSSGREWSEAIIFAVFAATFIRMFLIEAYVIPTSSMEGSLLVGDFLFVSKAHYGIRTPQTVLQFPLVHNTIPGINTESYLRSPQLKMRRLPAIESIDHNDPVVFNYPEGDSVYLFPGRIYSIHDARRNPGLSQAVKRKKLRVRPIDKRDHYIKRCVALPGDKFEIKDRQIYIDDQAAVNPTNLQYRYRVNTPGATPNATKLREWEVSPEDFSDNLKEGTNTIVLNQGQIDKIKESDKNATFEIVKMSPDPMRIFPHDPANYPSWTVDNFGPITIPQAGATVDLSFSNMALYKRIIEVYEGPNQVQFDVNRKKVLINGEVADTYTFKMDYYWMMGDNRHNSEDSRYWGFMPADHVVGKPLFVWFSTKEGNIWNGIRWSRIFTGATKM